MTRYIALVLGAAPLAGCTSGSNEAVGDSAGDATFVAAAQARLDDADYDGFDNIENYTDPAVRPASGSAEFEGYMALYLDGRPAVGVDTTIIPKPSDIGLISLEVAFGATGSVTGTADRSFDEDETEFGGPLTVSNSKMNPTQNLPDRPAFVTDLNGTLTAGTESYVIDAEMGGAFVGENYEGVAGLVLGQVTGSETGDFVGGSMTVRD